MREGSGIGRAFNRKHYLITSNLKSNCVVLLSILLLVSAFGWILFIRFTYIHTHTHIHLHCAHRHNFKILIHTYSTYVCILLFRFFFTCVSRFLYLLATAQLFLCYFIFLIFLLPYYTLTLTATADVAVAAASTQLFSVLTTLKYCHWFHILLHKLTTSNDLWIFVHLTIAAAWLPLSVAHAHTHNRTHSHRRALNDDLLRRKNFLRFAFIRFPKGVIYILIAFHREKPIIKYFYKYS